MPVRGVKIVWAQYADKVHCPPAMIVVQTSLTGQDGSWKEVSKIAPHQIPRAGQPYDADRQWRYSFPKATSARYLRLAFPKGAQVGTKKEFDGYV